MKINRQELIATLLLVRPGLATKAIVEQSDCFAFQDGKLFTYNDEVAVCHPTELNLEGAVNGKKLLDLLNKSKDDELDFEIVSGELLVKGRKSKAGVKLEADVRLPMDLLGSPTKWYKLPEDFSNSIKFCLFSTSTDASKPLLTCVHVVNNVVESCDNFRMTRIMMKGDILEELLIPASCIKNLCGYNPVEYGKTNGWLHFRNKDNTVFSCRTYTEQYPDLERVKSVDGESFVWPEGLREALDRACIFSESKLRDSTERAEVNIAEGVLKVRGEGDHGWYEEEMRIRGKASAQFDINVEFFQDLLGKAEGAIIGERALKFEGENWFHVVSLIGRPK